MKKTCFLLLLCIFELCSATRAQDLDTLHFRTINVPGIPGPGDDDNNGGGRPRTPVLPPSVAIDGHTLYILDGCDGAELAIVSADDDEVYTASLPEGTTLLVLPEWLQGTYELQIRRGQYVFAADIEL